MYQDIIKAVTAALRSIQHPRTRRGQFTSEQIDWLALELPVLARVVQGASPGDRLRVVTQARRSRRGRRPSAADQLTVTLTACPGGWVASATAARVAASIAPTGRPYLLRPGQKRGREVCALTGALK